MVYPASINFLKKSKSKLLENVHNAKRADAQSRYPVEDAELLFNLKNLLYRYPQGISIDRVKMAFFELTDKQLDTQEAPTIGDFIDRIPFIKYHRKLPTFVYLDEEERARFEAELAKNKADEKAKAESRVAAVVPKKIDTLEIPSEKWTLKPDEHVEVEIQEIYNPGMFYVTYRKNKAKLKELGHNLNKAFNGSKLTLDASEILMGNYVAAFYDLDGEWCRAKITDVISEDEIEVFYIDYGSKSTLPSSKLRPLTKALMELPAQAFACRLSSVRPVGNQFRWPHAACIRFLELCDNKFKALQAIYVEKRIENVRPVHP